MLHELKELLPARGRQRLGIRGPSPLAGFHVFGTGNSGLAKSMLDLCVQCTGDDILRTRDLLSRDKWQSFHYHPLGPKPRYAPTG
jgi:hypothetical protein